MPDTRLILPPAGSSSPPTGGRVREIPEDLLREAANRLRLSALIGVVLWLVGLTLDHLARQALEPDNPAWRQLHAGDAVAAVGILTSLGFYLYARYSRRPPRFMLDLGLVYLVLTSFSLAIIAHVGSGVHTATIQPTFSWVASLVLIFAAIIPNPPGKTLVAGLIAVSMNPVAMLIARAQGAWDFEPGSHAFLMHYPDYIMVGVSVVISRVVTRLGQQVGKARELGSYRVGELLGKGGMGEVYHATHRMLARPAAIKLIRAGMLGGGDPEALRLALRRFRREAEVAASLRSPHTVELYDFGATEDQSLYYVMELLDGLDLEALVRMHGAQPANRVVHILRQACESLEEAHARGLVHRDIKPANIHLGRMGLRHDFVKVLDFGLVKSIADAAAGGDQEHSLGTGMGQAAGTPAYMAPETALGEAVDARTDLYALGCVAYYLLTGTVVFEAATSLQAVARHINDPPVPPSERLGAPLPAGLDALVLALLAKRPENRPGDAAEVARRLEAVEVERWGETQAAAWWTELGGKTGR